MRHSQSLQRHAARSCRRFPATRYVHSGPSAVYLDPAKSQEPPVASTPSGLSEPQRHILDSAVRVDQAGELAANWIYMGQMAVLGRDRTTGPLIQASAHLRLDVTCN